MIKYWLIVVLGVTASGKMLAQELRDRFAMADSAAQAFNSKDTTGAIQYLELYTRTYPKSWLMWMVSARLADLYKQRQQYDSALSKLNRILQLSPRYDSVLYAIGSSGAAFLQCNKFLSVKGDVFTSLSDLYVLKYDLPKALDCLKKADSCYVHFNGGCGNEIIGNLTGLSIKYADFYLRTGDTTSAINRLLEYCFWQENHSLEAIRKLCPLLLSRYSASAILKELEKGVADSYDKAVWVNGKREKRIHFSLFGYNYQWMSGISSAGELKKYLPHGSGFTLLKEIVTSQN